MDEALAESPAAIEDVAPAKGDDGGAVVASSLSWFGATTMEAPMEPLPRESEEEEEADTETPRQGPTRGLLPDGALPTFGKAAPAPRLAGD